MPYTIYKKSISILCWLLWSQHKSPILQSASKDAPYRNCNFVETTKGGFHKTNKSYEAPLSPKMTLQFCGNKQDGLCV